MAQSYEPIGRGAEYRCIEDFENALIEWETKHGHQFRVGSSENLRNRFGMKDEVFEYRVLVLQCVHYGNSRDRSLSTPKRKRPSSARHLPCGCSAMLRLNFSQREQLLRITSLIDVHTGHKLEPGKHEGRKCLTEKRRSVKRARMSDSYASPMTPGQNLQFGVKPKMPFPMISALAILNSPQGKLLTKEIYIFFETYFPFFRTAYGSWKNSVRHALHTHNYFEKQLGPNKSKVNLMFSIGNMERFERDIAAFADRFPDRKLEIYGLSNPEHWDLMIKGDLKSSKVAIHRPKAIFPKSIKHEDSEDDMEPFIIIPNSPSKSDSPSSSDQSTPPMVVPPPEGYPKWYGENNVLPLRNSFDQDVPLDHLKTEMKPLASSLPQNHFPLDPIHAHLSNQYPLNYALPGYQDLKPFQGLELLADAAQLVNNYTDVRYL